MQICFVAIHKDKRLLTGPTYQWTVNIDIHDRNAIVQLIVTSVNMVTIMLRVTTEIKCAGKAFRFRSIRRPPQTERATPPHLSARRHRRTVTCERARVSDFILSKYDCPASHYINRRLSETTIRLLYRRKLYIFYYAYCLL